MNKGLNSFPNKEVTRRINVGTYAINPADATTYYFSTAFFNPQTGGTNIIRGFNFKAPAVITGANIEWQSTGFTPTSEVISVYVQVNGVDDYLIEAAGFPSVGGGLLQARGKWYNNNLNILLKPDDIWVIKVVCPTWVTNPQNAPFGGYIEYKTRS